MRRADNLTTFICRFFRNLGTSISWNPPGSSRPVQGLVCYVSDSLIAGFLPYYVACIQKAPLLLPTVTTHPNVNKICHNTDSDPNTSEEPSSKIRIKRPERGVDYRVGNGFRAIPPASLW